MGLEVSSAKELKWVEGEQKRQRFYYALVILTFILMTHAFVTFVRMPETQLSPNYRITFFYAFLAFMVNVQVLYKSRKYLKIIDMILEERRNTF
ncbi:MAG: hypothetical protein KBD53_08110 [Candidatus Omnitrophica bacterium]|nr:hypothetical protein [Candidatus Omnitrophota bacterium]